MSDHPLLPDIDQAGDVQTWYLPVKGSSTDPLDTSDVDVYRTYARFLGMGSSRTSVHQNHPRTRYVRRGDRCNACRWFEIRIFRELELPPGVESIERVLDPAQVRLGNYIMHSSGMSIVDGEVPLMRYEATASPFQVIESMTTRRVTTESGPQVYLAKPAARALAEASGYDQQLADAYINRAVS